MVTKEELFAAVQTIKNCCAEAHSCFSCVAYMWCISMRQGAGLYTPRVWPDPEEGDSKE